MGDVADGWRLIAAPIAGSEAGTNNNESVGHAVHATCRSRLPNGTCRRVSAQPISRFRPAVGTYWHAQHALHVPKPVEQLDSRIEIVTPENIAFKYRVAGPFRRLPAYAIDCLIRTGVLVVIYFFAHASLHMGLIAGLSLFLYAWFVLEWFYGGLFETYWNGQTPGKWALGLRVVSNNGHPIDARQAVMRNVLRAVDSLPVVFQFGLISIVSYQLGLFVAAANKQFRRLGDLAAGTIVVVEESPRLYGVARVGEAEAKKLADEIPVNFEPSRSLARALSVYVERRAGFAWGRRAEIARHLAEPLRIKFNLPPETNHDLLLCAVYYRVFVVDRVGEKRESGRPAPPRQPPLSPRQGRAAEVQNLLDQMA